MDIILDAPKEVVTQEEVKTIVTDVKIIQYTDNFEKVEGIVTINGGKHQYMLFWDGADYISIGQFKDADLENRVLELLGLKQ